tara:strand:- start:1852 stop:2520 length:669 start_codon:yes stop_codon:yes gene_type:complete
MIFKKIKKYKKLSILFFSILILINIFTYVFQINSVKKIYNVEMVLKNSIKYELEKDTINNKLKTSRDISNFTGAISTSIEMRKYIHKRFQNVISFESDSNENYKKIKSLCTSSNIRINQEFIMVQCKTVKPNNVDTNIKEHLDVILLKIMTDKEFEIATARKLMKLGNITFSINKANPTELLSSSVIYSENRLRNILTLNSIFVFLTVVFILSYFNRNKTKN